eukprot:TRINITY_DN47826_c0_g1_i1.p1 TRINITY_DN47826_c0_g1~~TRINITY_DN47826_c0_g1_i1.p1  ORF type:complete len:333 (+),score=108.92 TRINITY_DN47826_c0_g1_i1:70-1068(+)
MSQQASAQRLARLREDAHGLIAAEHSRQAEMDAVRRLLRELDRQEKFGDGEACRSVPAEDARREARARAAAARLDRAVVAEERERAVVAGCERRSREAAAAAAEEEARRAAARAKRSDPRVSGQLVARLRRQERADAAAARRGETVCSEHGYRDILGDAVREEQLRRCGRPHPEDVVALGRPLLARYQRWREEGAPAAASRRGSTPPHLRGPRRSEPSRGGWCPADTARLRDAVLRRAGGALARQHLARVRELGRLLEQQVRLDRARVDRPPQQEDGRLSVADFGEEVRRAVERARSASPRRRPPPATPQCVSVSASSSPPAAAALEGGGGS